MGTTIIPVEVLTRNIKDAARSLAESDLLSSARKEGMTDLDLVFDVDAPKRGQLITHWPDLEAARAFAGRASDEKLGDDVQLGQATVSRAPEYLEHGNVEGA